MHARMECWILTSKNSAKLKQYYYFHAEFLEERYINFIMQGTLISNHIKDIGEVQAI